MAIKIVSIAGQYVLRETSYTDDSYRLFNRYAMAKRRDIGFGNTRRLRAKMRKTEPRGKVFKRIVRLKVESVERAFRQAEIVPVTLKVELS